MNATLELDQPIQVTVEGLQKKFTLHLREAQNLSVLSNFSMSAAPGECVALSGPSGRGKSTILRCLFGNYKIDAGSIVLRQADGKQVDLAGASDHQLIDLRRTSISLVSQFLRAVPRVSALDVVAERLLEGLSPMPDSEYERRRDEAREQAGTLLGRLNMPRSLWKLPPATFSGGEQQRVNIARGFIRPTGLILLDEPTASLDNTNRDVVIALIAEAKAAGRTIIGIFHDDAIREQVADRTISL